MQVAFGTDFTCPDALGSTLLNDLVNNLYGRHKKLLFQYFLHLYRSRTFSDHEIFLSNHHYIHIDVNFHCQCQLFTFILNGIWRSKSSSPTFAKIKTSITWQENYYKKKLPVLLAQPPSPDVDCQGHVIWKLVHRHLSSTCQFDSGKKSFIILILPFSFSLIPVKQLYLHCTNKNWLLNT